MKVLITHSYFLKLDSKQYSIAQPYPPLATLYAVSALRNKGMEVIFFDTMFCNSATDIVSVLDGIKPDVFVIYDDGFNYLTKMCLTNMRFAAFEMCKYAKKINAKVIVSSSDSTDHYIDYLNNGADYIIKGEGEVTLLELVSELKIVVPNLSRVNGVCYLNNGSVVENPPRTVIKNLDEISFPAWDLLNIEPYRKMWLKSSGYFSINMVTTRGCPYKCNWCAKPIYGNRYNSRSPENVVNEILLLQKMFKLQHIWFCDDIFGLKPGWVHHFSELLKVNNLSVRFKIQSRVDLLLTDKQLEPLASAGCEIIWVGAESGSQKILDAMDKGTKVEQIYEATLLMKKYKIKPAFFLQFGYPGESYLDIKLTIKMLNDLLPHDIGISVSYPLPGTKFYDNVKSELMHKANWADSDDLDLMFKNKYSAQFYKQLHRFVHKNYRRNQGISTLLGFFNGKTRLSFSNIKRALSPAYFVPAALFEKKKLKSLAPANE